MTVQQSDKSNTTSPPQTTRKLNRIQLLTALALIAIPSTVLFPTIAASKDKDPNDEPYTPMQRAAREIVHVQRIFRADKRRLVRRINAGTQEVLLASRRYTPRHDSPQTVAERIN